MPYKSFSRKLKRARTILNTSWLFDWKQVVFGPQVLR
jgi:hypothetical protein